MLRLREWARKINIDAEVRCDEPLARHTTFRVGGPADVLIRPNDTDSLAELIRRVRDIEVPSFVLGGGSNILVSDHGIRGVVIDTTGLSGVSVDGTRLTAGAGMPISDVAAFAADHDLAGLDFIYAMPGTVGGAVWMNARCYGGEIAGVLASVTSVESDASTDEYHARAEDFAYKQSPFMSRTSVMTRVSFNLRPGDGALLWQAMREHEADRRAKGHFAAPCAGSVFKNNRAYGRPSGAIIDSLGLRGHAVGAARVSDLHANIVVNAGGATASDIRALIDDVQRIVRERLGLELEREVLYVGDWREYERN